MSTEPAGAGLLERLENGPVICAEGYLFEFERRGYLQAGAYVPEIVLEHPEMVAGLHREFVHAGSDVVEAFTYYAHREKMRIIGKEHLIEPLNRSALTIARQVADEHGCLAAGDLSNTNAFHPDDATRRQVRGMFEEQVGWIAEAGMDYIVAETFSWGEEALLALEVIKEAGMTAVVTLSIHREGDVREGWSPEDTCARLEQAGADVVGLNCIRGPRTMLPLVARIRDAVSCHVAALPVPYRTTEEEPSFQSLTDPDCDCLPNDRPFPTALEPLSCNRYEIAEFGSEAYALGIRYLGVCCGAAPHMIRSLAEALDRDTPASRYSPDMTRHSFLGTDAQLHAHNQQYAREL
ncbi:MAG: homocysteine S-methyltransferase family protein [Solirubrobacteraceae bacterium]